MATLEEIVVSYLDRHAERVAEKVATIIMQRLAAGRPVADVAAHGPPTSGAVPAPSNERRAVLPQQQYDRPLPGGLSAGQGGPVAPPQPVVDAPPQPPPAPPEDRRPVVLGAQLGAQPAPTPAPERTA